MADWSAFYPDILPELVGAPLPLVDHHLRLASIEFCRRSKAWRRDVSALSVASQANYTLTLPAQSALVEIMSCRYDGNPLIASGREFLEDTFGDWQNNSGTPAYFTAPTADLWLCPKPSQAGKPILTTLALRPVDGATALDDWVFWRFRPAIGKGCLARMLTMDGSWAKPDKAPMFFNEFEMAIQAAQTQANAGFVRERPSSRVLWC